jgi:hypothetical protein
MAAPGVVIKSGRKGVKNTLKSGKGCGAAQGWFFLIPRYFRNFQESAAGCMIRQVSDGCIALLKLIGKPSKNG